MTYPIPSTDDLLDELASGLTNAWDRTRLSEKRVSALYELYIFKLVIEAARKSGEFRDIQYRIPEQDLPIVKSSVLFQTGPHQIYDAGYCYAELSLRQRRYWEVHVGTKFRGKSGVEHEADIAILSRRSAQRFRNDNIAPDYSKLIFAAECKFYSSNIRLDLSREFLGLTSDITAPRRRNFFITSTCIVQNGIQLLDKHERAHHDILVPSNTTQIGQFQNVLVEIFSRSTP